MKVSLIYCNRQQAYEKLNNLKLVNTIIEISYEDNLVMYDLVFSSYGMFKLLSVIQNKIQYAYRMYERYE